MRLNTPWAFYDPVGLCLRTSQPSLLDGPDSTLSSLDLPASGCLQGGRVYALPMLGRRTVVNGGSSLLGTPRVGRNGQASSVDVASGDLKCRLEAQVASLLPTPRSTDGPKGGPGQVNGRGVADSLPAIGALLPTPCAQEPGGTVEGYHARLAKADGRESTFVPLGMVAQLLPTPTVGDAANAANKAAQRSDPDSKHHDGTTLVDATRLLPTPRATRGGSSTEMQYELGATTAPPSPDGNTSSDVPPRPPLTTEDDSPPRSSNG